MMNDRPIHLRPSTQPHTEASVTCPVWLTQSSLDGMQAMIQFCSGMEAAGKGRIPGSFEIVMFYRTLCDAVRKHYTELDKINPPPMDEFVEVSETA